MFVNCYSRIVKFEKKLNQPISNEGYEKNRHSVYRYIVPVYENRENI